MKQAPSRPNVIFVLTDDQGYGDLSCHGNPILRTPCLDRLHGESVRCNDFHVSPMCTPSRGELLTGRDALRNGATFVCMGRSLLRADLPTAADIFAANGYHTGHFGKWHLGDNYPYRPQDRGFHESIWHPGFGITSAPDYFGNDYFDDVYRHRDELEQYKGYCTDVWFTESMNWMRRCQRDGTPFFTYLATNAPHGPLWVPDHYRDPYRDGLPHAQASFFAMIANIDENMGRLDAFLHETGLRDDTIVIFMTDNGTASGMEVFNAGMRGKKTSLYDGGHRVPCFVRWPAGGIGGGRDVTGMTRGIDLLPTLIDLCGLQTDDGLTFDGVSFAGPLRNAAEPVADRTAVVQYGHRNEGTYGYTGEHNAAVLWQTWRLVNGCELYDIASDPGQQRDVADEHRDIAARLRDHYEGWWAANGGVLDTYRSLTIGSPRENPMRLCSPDWAWAYADNAGNIRGATDAVGTWHVDVARAGMYRMTLRRWPEESGLAITAPAPVMQGVDGKLPEGKSIPAASAHLRVGDATQSQPLPPDAHGVAFELPLRQGPAQIRSWWNDDEGRELAGAYYLTAEHVGK